MAAEAHSAATLMAGASFISAGGVKMEEIEVDDKMLEAGHTSHAHGCAWIALARSFVRFVRMPGRS